MAKVFPKVTKCTFFKYGPSGTVEKKDGLCVLPLNIINEKIYIFIWCVSFRKRFCQFLPIFSIHNFAIGTFATL
jgi:hypothetical protein